MFFKRLASSITLWTIFLLSVFVLPPYFTLLLLNLVAAIGLWEFYVLCEKKDLKCYRFWGLAGGVALLTGSWVFQRDGLDNPEAVNFEIGVLVVFVLGVFIRQFPQKNNPHAVETMAYTLFGLMYVPWLFSFIAKLNFFPPHPLYKEMYPHYDAARILPGKYLVLFLILVAKFSDVGAYVVGSILGKHKMIPRISPNKTWEGFAGAILVSMGAGYIGYYLMEDYLEVFRLTAVDGVILGALLGFAAIVGDLAESLIKRDVGAKDSGQLLPGIGGALDLIDSLLFTAPLLYVYLRLVYP